MCLVEHEQMDALVCVRVWLSQWVFENVWVWMAHKEKEFAYEQDERKMQKYNTRIETILI